MPAMSSSLLQELEEDEQLSKEEPEGRIKSSLFSGSLSMALCWEGEPENSIETKSRWRWREDIHTVMYMGLAELVRLSRERGGGGGIVWFARSQALLAVPVAVLSSTGDRQLWGLLTI
ncbi:hypothetical protein V6N13_143475 [Hibiscus sabdariffa]|uniref:Uncharacterized protein n=1 Tax=Hibiscus sabdariffa TaxID=183260 RepID=A0ABR2FHE7_9ROSI